MVASTPSPFVLDPAQTEAFLEDISSFDMCLRDVAKKYNTTVGGLALFITSEDGLQAIATSELAAALRIRLTALHLLPDVVQAMGYIVNEYSREERRIPMENSLRRIRLLELKRRNAHRAGTLIFKLAHFNPRPIKSYTVRPAAQRDPAAQRVQPCASSTESDVLAAPSAQACGMPKRPLGHGSATEAEVADCTAIELNGFASPSMNACAVQDDPAAQGIQACASSNESDVVAAQSVQTCGMPKRPLGHGSAFEPEVAVARAVEINGFASTSMNTCAVQDDPDAQCVQTCVSSNESDVLVVQSAQTCGMPKRPLGHGSAFEPEVAASRAVEAVGSASTSTRFASLHEDEVSVSSSHVSSSPVSLSDVSSSPVSPSSTLNSDPPSPGP